MENGRITRSMVFVYITIQAMDNMKVTTTRTKNMPMVKLNLRMVNSMKVNITMVRRKAMVFIPLQMEPNTMGLGKTIKCMELDSGTRMDEHIK